MPGLDQLAANYPTGRLEAVRSRPTRAPSRDHCVRNRDKLTSPQSLTFSWKFFMSSVCRVEKASSSAIRVSYAYKQVVNNLVNCDVEVLHL